MYYQLDKATSRIFHMWFWILLLPIAVMAVILSVAQLRRRLLTRHILAWFQKALPKMSSTEQEAIDAGDTWHEADLFKGKPNWQQFLKTPKPTLTVAEQNYLDNEVETLCNMLNDWQITQDDLDLPPEVWEYLKKSKFFGLHIPPQFGGLGFSSVKFAGTG